MKPQPRQRPALVIPKAEAPDPASLNAGITTNASITTNAGVHAEHRAPRRASSVKKLTLRLDEDDIGRIRAAWINDLAHGGRSPSLNAWLTTLIMRQVEAAEQSSNAGEHYTPIPAGQIPTGRPRSL